MRFVRFARPDREGFGIGRLDDDGIRLLPFPSMAAALQCELSELRAIADAAATDDAIPADTVTLLAPVDGRTLVWAAGVTYQRSLDARVEESHVPDVYDRVYGADRPELFLKAVSWKVVTSGDDIAIRADSALNVPEAELALVINRGGQIVGYTVCNDVSSRSIEAENPLYLPQAKVYDSSCALAPGIVPVWEVADAQDLVITGTVTRAGVTAWTASVHTSELMRELDDLVEHLWRDQTFDEGVILSTGTGIVPEMSFTLQGGDIVEVDISGVGTLVNTVTQASAR